MGREDGGWFVEQLCLEKARMRRRGWVVAGKRQTRAWWRVDLFFSFFPFFPACFRVAVEAACWAGFDMSQIDRREYYIHEEK